MAVPPLVLTLLDALEEPALLVAGERTLAANPPARALLGHGVVGQNIRFAIRQPQALDAIVSARTATVEVTGIGGVDRSWRVVVILLEPGLLLVRLFDRSAQRATEKAQIDFVANASHELRTPLAAVIGYAETLADEGAIDEALRRRFGAQIHGQAKRMLRIVQDLMGLSRIEADRFSAPRHLVSLPSVVGEAAAAAAPLCEINACGLALEIDDTLEPIRGDQGQLRQVVDNLLGNALRYGCRNAGDVVAVRLSASGQWQQLEIEDGGDGIAAEHLPRLTERFYRVDPGRSRDSGGTGLGLAIVKQVVERHRGLLDIRSQQGKGTTVIVRLPTH